MEAGRFEFLRGDASPHVEGGPLKSLLERAITEAALAAKAGQAAFARGTAYFDHGAVLDLVETRGVVKARVRGSDEYRVELRADRGGLSAACSCPVGEDGEFCKHAVATGLAWLAQSGDDESRPSDRGGGDLAGVRTWLAGQDKRALVDLLVDEAENEPELRARLQSAALRSNPPGDPKALKKTVSKVLAAPNGFVDWRGMRAFVARAETVTSLLRGLLERNRAQDAAALADHALRRGIAVYESTDDSGGGFGEVLREIAALHLQACRAANPEGEALAKSLFELQMLDHWAFFGFEHYVPLLGKGGLVRYRTLAEAAWRDVPTRKPGARREPGVSHFLITRIMETLAHRDGDVDALIAVKSRDLSRSHAFVEIAELCMKAGRPGEALEWAERGYAAFPGELNIPLVELLVAAYLREKRFEDAMRTAWDHFTQHPGLGSYDLLRKTAGSAEDWKDWRENALAHLRAEVKAVGRGPSVSRPFGGHSLLVEVFLNDGDVGAALAEARSGGCSHPVWMKLAGACERDRPGDAAEIYQARIDTVVDRKNDQAYEEAAEMVGRIWQLLERAGRREEFAHWVEGLRVKHKAKRNLMKRLEHVAGQR